jgi:predicted nucleic acid-binding protein
VTSVARFALDTSCMVAAVCSWHEHHARAAAEVDRRLRARQTLIAPAPALVETYAVLTRLPPPHRVSSADALLLVEANFVTDRRLASLDAAAYLSILRGAPARGVAGGRIYDAIIAQCAIESRASCLLTFNARHFLPLAATDLEIFVP